MVSSAIISGIFRDDFLQLRRLFAFGEVECPAFLLGEPALRAADGFGLEEAVFEAETVFPERAFTEPFAETLGAVFFSEAIMT